MGKLNTIQNGKGSRKRPVKNLELFNQNWDLIFKKKEKEENTCKKEQKEDNK